MPASPGMFGRAPRSWSLLVTALLGLLFALWAAEQHARFRAFDALGYGGVFAAQRAWQLGVCALSALLAGALTFASTRSALARCRRLSAIALRDPDGIARVSLSAVADKLCAPASLTVAAGAAFAWRDAWIIVLGYANAAASGKRDPAFGRDLAFYLFDLPFYELVTSLLLAILAACALLASLVFAAHGRAAFAASGPARAHLLVLLTLACAVVAVDAHYAAFGLLYGTPQRGFAGDYTDLHGTLPALRVFASVALGSSLVCAVAARRGWLRLAAAALVALATAGTAVLLVPAAMRSTVHADDARLRARRLDATLAAYALSAATPSGPAAPHASEPEREPSPKALDALHAQLRELAPFLRFTSATRFSLRSGATVFVSEGLCTSETYPYALASGRLHALRPCARAVLDLDARGFALYATAPHDALLHRFMRALPGLLRPTRAMAEELRELPVAKAVARMQARVLGQLHTEMTSQSRTNARPAR